MSPSFAFRLHFVPGHFQLYLKRGQCHCATWHTGVAFTTYKESIYALLQYLSRPIAEFHQEGLFPQASLLYQLWFGVCRTQMRHSCGLKTFLVTIYKAVITTERRQTGNVKHPNYCKCSICYLLWACGGKERGLLAEPRESVCAYRRGALNWSCDLGSE